MVICFNGHCYEVPEVQWAFRRPGGVGPVNYPQFLGDATILASLQTAAALVAKDPVRDRLMSGIAEAIGEMSRLAGNDVEIRESF